MHPLLGYLSNRIDLLKNVFVRPGETLPGLPYANSVLVKRLPDGPSDGSVFYITLCEVGTHNKTTGTIGGFRESSGNNSVALFNFAAGSGATAGNASATVFGLQVQADNTSLVELRYNNKTYVALKLAKPQYQELNSLYFRGDSSDLSVIMMLKANQVTNVVAHNGNGYGATLLGGTYYGKGDGLTNLNASQLVTGTIPAARLPLVSGSANGAMTPTLLNKLNAIAPGATVNSTDAQLRDRATHTGTQAIATISGLQSALDNKVNNNDARLSNSREWTASTVSKAEAEAGVATTRRAWTSLLVRQATVAWWNSSAMKTKLDGIQAGAQVNIPVGTTAGTVCAGDDPRLTAASDWSATLISQAEAEAGTATTERKFNALRIHQAAGGWWNKSAMKTKLDGIQAGAQVNVPSNLSASSAADKITVANSFGTGFTINVATTGAVGLMSAAMVSKLNGIQAGAQVNLPTTASRTDASTTTVLQAKGMNDHRTSGDHDARYLKLVGGTLTGKLTMPLTYGNWISGFRGGAAVTIDTVGAASNYSAWLTQRTPNAGWSLGTIGDEFVIATASKANIDSSTNTSLQALTISTGGVLGGNGGGLTNLNASNLASGTVPIARISSTAARNSTSVTALLQAKAMNDHVNSGDHDTRYARLNATAQTAGYLYLMRNDAAHPALYVNQAGNGDIARFFKGSSATATDGNGIIIKNDGTLQMQKGVNWDGNTLGSSWARGLNYVVSGAVQGGIGGFGNASGLTTIYLGLGVTPWNSGNGIRVNASGVSITGIMSGRGDGLTNLNASNLTTGKVPIAALNSVTLSEAGVMTPALLEKLNGIQTGAQVNVPTNLGYSASTVAVSITSSTGNNTTIFEATTSRAGVMNTTMVNKLNSIQPAAQVNPPTTASRGSTSTTTVLQAKGMNDHINSGDHDSRYLRQSGGTVSGTLLTYALVATGGSASSDYNTGQLLLRTDVTNAVPTLGFQLVGKYAGLITMDTAETFSLYKSGKSEFADLRLNKLIALNDVEGFSDITLKDNVEPIKDALDKVKQIGGYTYNRNDLNGKRQIGVLAQEVQKILPEVVGSNGKLLTVSYGNLAALLIEAIKELSRESEAKISKLENEITSIKEVMNELVETIKGR